MTKKKGYNLDHYNCIHHKYWTQLYDNHFRPKCEEEALCHECEYEEQGGPDHFVVVPIPWGEVR